MPAIGRPARRFFIGREALLSQLYVAEINGIDLIYEGIATQPYFIVPHWLKYGDQRAQEWIEAILDYPVKDP